MADMNKMAGDVITAMQGFVRRALGPLAAQVTEINEWRKALPVDLKGEKGDRGDPGQVGERGATGPVGQRGEAGIAGEKGVDGARGERGERGEQGQPGERGEKGDAGEAGKDGADGGVGEIGPAGAVGAQGEKGDVGPQGAQGDQGEKGLPGLAGDVGPRGEKGEAGEDGRDAAQIEVLDAIDPAKRYQRGTFATHRGGLVRSFRATDFLPVDASLEKSGWHVVVRGMDEIAVDFGDDLRTFGIAVRMTDGAVVTKQFASPVVIDRGIFKADGEYVAGDGATWSGSFWIAQRKTAANERPGDASGAWRLAVKSGRDGRDGNRGEKGERGAEGRAGRDLTQVGPDGAKW